jgi:hypothetical protein
VEAPDIAQWLYPGFDTVLQRSEAEGYFHYVSTAAPNMFVLWRMEGKPGCTALRDCELRRGVPLDGRRRAGRSRRYAASDGGLAAACSYRKSKSPRPSQSPGADHAHSRPPDADLTRREAQNQMPKPGQANDHSTTARDPRNSSGR